MDAAPAGAHPVIVSACLAGVPCRYDATARPDPEVVAAVAEGRAVPLCAEVLGSLGVPRPPAEVVGPDGEGATGADGADVLDGRARVVTADGQDLTRAFLDGARAVAEHAERVGARSAVLRAGSPSCGAGGIYDGTFSGRLVPGDGVLAALLRRQGLSVRSR
ncbi:DUF523 domain-containing protein [Actinomyces sp. 186855]|nr:MULTISPECIES: DUF523 domain-containing protein [unclassified Actinomyces]MCL3776714.1 DUF523 domain-containing protein [Actinomyces sp. AC-20-1]MCL3790832.1 DUF523 domain-containing protein [Actinomyces sp. 187325]MCL3792028.1 DUF523 domain-containing protein [Actinomyces sp. 186855]MCL3795556.1 DUF523 domain-containing protein [Actinomyces sp. 217892]